MIELLIYTKRKLWAGAVTRNNYDATEHINFPIRTKRVFISSEILGSAQQTVNAMTMLCATPHQSESDQLTLSEQPLPPATVSSCGATPPAVDRQNTLKREEKSRIKEQLMPTHVIEE